MIDTISIWGWKHVKLDLRINLPKSLKVIFYFKHTLPFLAVDCKCCCMKEVRWWYWGLNYNNDDIDTNPHLVADEYKGIVVISDQIESQCWYEVQCQRCYHHSVPACQREVVTRSLSHTQLRVLLSLHSTVITHIITMLILDSLLHSHLSRFKNIPPAYTIKNHRKARNLPLEA